MADFDLMQNTASGLRGEGQGGSRPKPSSKSSTGGQKFDVATAIAKGLDMPSDADSTVASLSTTAQQAVASTAKSGLKRLRKQVDASIAEQGAQGAVALCETRISVARSFLTDYAHDVLTHCTLPIEREREVLKALSGMVARPAATLIADGIQILLNDVQSNPSKHEDEVGNLGKNDKVM